VAQNPPFAQHHSPLEPGGEIVLETGLKLSIGFVGHLVDSTLYGVFGFAESLLSVAFDLLTGSFTLEAIRANSFPNVLFCFANRFICRSFDFVCGRAHYDLPRNVEVIENAQ
jgi:hypothetical protein